MDKFRYRFKGNVGYPIDFSIGKKPKEGIYVHIQFPPVVTPDIVVFAGKMAETGPNLNRAFFAHDEMLKAYPSLSYKALDLEHGVEAVVGHIYSGVYVNRTSNKIITPEEYADLSMEQMVKDPWDVVVGNVAYIDRFPTLEAQLERKSYCLSMEAYLETFSLLLENGTRITLDEAFSLGLDDFVSQLMGEFESSEDFENAHSLMVTTADNKQQIMKVYKYLHNFIWSGVALVDTPACPSCMILQTSCDDTTLQAAAACVCKDKSSQVHSIDLRKVDSYMEKERNSKKIKKTNVQVPVSVQADEINPEFPKNPPIPTPVPNDLPPASVESTPVDQTNKPAPCPNYMLNEDMLCTYAQQQCEIAGDRTSKSCFRWSEDDAGKWNFDDRSTKDDPIVTASAEEPIVPTIENKDNLSQWVSLKIEQMVNTLEAFHLERSLRLEEQKKREVNRATSKKRSPNSKGDK